MARMQDSSDHEPPFRVHVTAGAPSIACGSVRSGSTLGLRSSGERKGLTRLVVCSSEVGRGGAACFVGLRAAALALGGGAAAGTCWMPAGSQPRVSAIKALNAIITAGILSTGRSSFIVDGTSGIALGMPPIQGVAPKGQGCWRGCRVAGCRTSGSACCLRARCVLPQSCYPR